jgi:starvation-inducible outer membrane lipoprotein
MLYINYPNKMKKVFAIMALLFAALIGFGLYEYHKAPATLKNQKAEIVLSATELKEQLTNDSSARKRFGDKVILVEGIVSSVERGEHTAITIEASIRGELEKNTAVPEAGQRVRLKGMLGGYDEIFEEVVLIKCELED